MKNKKGIALRETTLWILAIIVLGVIILIIFFLKGRGSEILEKIFNALRFGK